MKFCIRHYYQCDALLLGGVTDATHLGFIRFPGRPINFLLFDALLLGVTLMPLSDSIWLVEKTNTKQAIKKNRQGHLS